MIGGGRVCACEGTGVIPRFRSGGGGGGGVKGTCEGGLGGNSFGDATGMELFIIITGVVGDSDPEWDEVLIGDPANAWGDKLA